VHEALHAIRKFDCKRLCDHAAEGGAYKVASLHTKMVQQLGAVVGDLRTRIAVVRFFARELLTKIVQDALVVFL
jgi:hypothetical protein